MRTGAERSWTTGRPCIVSGDLPRIHLAGPVADALIASLHRLEGQDFALIGGLAVMANLSAVHRPTSDLDGVFDNRGTTPTTALLVRNGIAEPSDPPHRIRVDGTDVDVIDTFPLPASLDELPDGPGSRLFVCAHRYAYETSTRVHLTTTSAATTVRVAAPPSLVAMKAHALRYGSRQRQATKRGSDLEDLYRLAAFHPDAASALQDAPWDLGAQARRALVETLTPVDQTAAALARVVAIEDAVEVLEGLVGPW